MCRDELNNELAMDDMDGKPSHKNYRIGDFAEYMGVTPDFLKHYEECGLLDVRQKENGYRYYNFDQSSRILEYMRLRNYGVTVKEMREMLMADADEAVRLLDEKVEELKRQSDRLMAVIEEHKRVQHWQRQRALKPHDWEVKLVQPLCFLPHSVHDNFIDDKRISVLLKNWMRWLPIAKSAMHIAPTGSSCEPYSTRWGIILPEAVAERYGIPINEVVERMPAAKSFVYHFFAEESAFSMDGISHGIHPMFKKLRELNLKPTGDFVLIVEMKLINPDGSRRGGYGRFIVPIES